MAFQQNVAWFPTNDQYPKWSNLIPLNQNVIKAPWFSGLIGHPPVNKKICKWMQSPLFMTFYMNVDFDVAMTYSFIVIFVLALVTQVYANLFRLKLWSCPVMNFGVSLWRWVSEEPQPPDGQHVSAVVVPAWRACIVYSCWFVPRWWSFGGTHRDY